MGYSFRDYIDKKYEERYEATAAITEVDAMEFVVSSRFLDEKPFPFQSLVIKLLYGLWKKYPITSDERAILQILSDEWGVNINLIDRDPDTFVKILILVMGRRSGKTSLISYIMSYEMYRLICKGDPQHYYGIRDRHPIQVVTCAKDGDQAKDPFNLAKDNIKRVEFFQKYIDPTKDNETDLRLFTPYDLLQNEKIRKYNESRPKGEAKKNALEGSLLLRSFTTSAGGKRGKAVSCVIFDEFAHFDRAKITGSMSSADILNEMPQTDYAMFKAITPAVKDFGKDGKIILLSSPREKGGEFYKYYCLAGGKEQVDAQSVVPNPNYLLFQLSSWQANPNRPRTDFDDDYKADPQGSGMEFGAHFGESCSTFIDAAQVDAMVRRNRPLTTAGRYGQDYIITIDPAKTSDTYAVGWGHAEGASGDLTYYIDGLAGFEPTYNISPSGTATKLVVNPANVVTFVKQLANSIQRTGGRIVEICYDQWNSVESIMFLQKIGFVAFETTFNNSYKEVMYGDFLEALNNNRVICYGAPQNDNPVAYKVSASKDWTLQLTMELKHLERVISGDTIYYGAPRTGVVQTDDFADIAANLVHRLCAYKSITIATAREYKKLTGQTVRVSSSIRPGTASSGFFKTGAGSVSDAKLKGIINRVKGGR